MRLSISYFGFRVFSVYKEMMMDRKDIIEIFRRKSSVFFVNWVEHTELENF